MACSTIGICTVLPFCLIVSQFKHYQKYAEMSLNCLILAHIFLQGMPPGVYT